MALESWGQFRDFYHEYRASLSYQFQAGCADNFEG